MAGNDRKMWKIFSLGYKSWVKYGLGKISLGKISDQEKI